MPDGTVLVDAAQWQQVQDGVAQANKLVEASRQKERDEIISAAMKAGKFPPVRGLSTLLTPENLRARPLSRPIRGDVQGRGRGSWHVRRPAPHHKRIRQRE